MSGDFVPQPKTNAPNSVTALDIIEIFKSSTGKNFDIRVQNLLDLIQNGGHVQFVNVDGSPYTNVQLNQIFTTFTNQILVNTQEINNLKHLIALLTFTLLEQGINSFDKELLRNLEIYLKLK